MHESLTYRSAGVDIDAGNELVDRIKKIVPRTYRPGVLGGLGGFAGCFELPVNRFQNPVLVSSTDGVGTKLRLAIDYQRHEGIGIDLVAMCVNDLVVMGAEPLFFLDYYATGQLDVTTAEKVIESIATGCQQANVALIGGETAEMPGHYAKQDYDLAGFCVGIAEKNALIDGSTIQPGDTLIALASSGPHANGFSLIRHIMHERKVTPDIDALLTPTRIYVPAILSIVKLMKGAAHITGGGFIDNIPRILPDHCAAKIISSTWQRPAIFKWLQTEGNLSDDEMHRTFNCGVGMIVCVAKENSLEALDLLKNKGETAWIIGSIVSAPGQQQVIFSHE